MLLRGDQKDCPGQDVGQKRNSKGDDGGTLNLPNPENANNCLYPLGRAHGM